MFILINRLIYLIKKFKDRNIPIQQYDPRLIKKVVKLIRNNQPYNKSF